MPGMQLLGSYSIYLYSVCAHRTRGDCARRTAVRPTGHSQMRPDASGPVRASPSAIAVVGRLRVGGNGNAVSTVCVSEDQVGVYVS